MIKTEMIDEKNGVRSFLVQGMVAGREGNDLRRRFVR